MDLAFLGRVSTEDAQDPEASRMWQIKRARDLVEPLGHTIVAEFFDIGQSRSLPWKRRPKAAALLDEIKRPDRRFDGVVIGEPHRAFYGHQFAMTFPVLTYFNCALFVPEVGGQVDPDSEAHEIMMGLFGGMSKSERTRIRKRVTTAMHELATHTDRHMGGRPAYGYTLADVGPHPNPGKAAAGQRAHKLSVDPATAPVVQRIFREFIAGMGVRAIAEGLASDGVPSPSAYDPARNSHRDRRGWAHQTVRAILVNPTYTGFRVWGKQEKFEALMNVDDVAAGDITRMRWRDTTQWIRPVQQTHDAIIDAETFDRAQERIGTRAVGAATRRPKTAKAGRVYPLAGRCFCVYCQCRLTANFFKSKKNDGTGRVLFKCDVGRKRALPPGLKDHPVSTLNQGVLLPLLDRHLAGLFADPAALAASLLADVAAPSAEVASLRQQISTTKREVGNLVAVLSGGVVSDAITESLVTKEANLAELKRRLDEIEAPTATIDSDEIAETLRRLGGAVEVLGQATDEERRDLYEALGVRVDFDARKREVILSVTPLITTGREDGSVREGT